MNDPARDQNELTLLDAYLDDLQAGRGPDRGALLRDHPQLASALDCLEALELLAPPSGAEGAGPDSAAAVRGAVSGPTPPAGDLPRDFGPYELIREIGRGGMGVVYEARQKGLDRSVAVKMILASNIASADLVRRFQAEAKAAARLRHSHIVHIHEVGQLHGQDFFAMEYIAGPSLAQRIAQGPVDVPTAVRLVATVARAVEHLHQQGIIHRDLKPSNILLDEEFQPYVSDFGLAKVFAPGAEMTATGVIAGTPSYMAPEQASSRHAEIGPATDVYSLGAILYELLTGQPPFHGETPLDTLMDVLSGDPVLPRTVNPRIPRGLELICLKCLEKAPQARYASAAAVAYDLERFARGEVLEVRPPTAAQRFWSWSRRQPALASRLAALSLFYMVETATWAGGHVDGLFHAKMSAVVAVWIIISIICQQFLETRRWAFAARYAWGLLDSAALLAVLLIGNGAASSLLVGYPLVIVGSALWFRVRFVWFVTGLSLLSYGVLVFDFYRWRPETHLGMWAGWDRHVIFAVAMLVLGAVVAYLVDRVRTLSNFYGRAL
jgi:eukaryotic-like serine/threonine-protein kinase